MIADGTICKVRATKKQLKAIRIVHFAKEVLEAENPVKFLFNHEKTKANWFIFGNWIIPQYYLKKI